jgi:hypothetical protein
MHFLIGLRVSGREKKTKFDGIFLLVKPSTSKQRQELTSTSWLLPSERQQHRPFSEQNEFGRNQGTKILSDVTDIFGNRRQATTIGYE